MKAIRN